MYGGGAAEISCSNKVSGAVHDIAGVEQYAVGAFGEALDSVAMALAENSGLNPIEAVGAIKARQVGWGRSGCTMARGGRQQEARRCS